MVTKRSGHTQTIFGKRRVSRRGATLASREEDREAGRAARRALERELEAVTAQDLAHDREADALSVLLRGKERREELRRRLGRDAEPCVFHDHRWSGTEAA